jgi:hypothetical protein
MQKLRVLMLLAFITVACGKDNVTGPSSGVPNVAGNYSGTTTMVLPELSRTVSCPTTTTVTQSGSTISIAPLQLGVACDNMSIPLGQATIDATGSLGQESGTFSETCGTYNYTASGGFFGRDLRLSFNATSQTCWNMNMTINLSR